jgi:NAD(P)H-flavin reductase
MYWIVSKEKYSHNIYSVDIVATQVSKNLKPGQCVKVKPKADSDFVSVVVNKVNVEKGYVSVLFHNYSIEHSFLANLTIGDEIIDVIGPFGMPFPVSKTGTVVCVASGLSIISMLPVAQALKEAGNRVVCILGASTSNYLFMVNEFRRFTDETILMTDDGSEGNAGTVTEGLQQLLLRKKINRTVAFGSAQMIKYTTNLCRVYNVPIDARLCEIDPTGMKEPAIFIVSVCDQSKYICVDGENFNAIYPDFDTMIDRFGERFHFQFEGNQDFAPFVSVED